MKFDFIFGDLTDTPVASTDDDDSEDASNSGGHDAWRFLRSIMDQALELLEVMPKNCFSYNE